MQTRKIIFSFPLVSLLVIGSYFFLDARIALAVQKAWLSNAGLALLSSEIPDLLFPMVCLITVLSWTAYFVLARKNIINRYTGFFQLLAWTLPVTYVLKYVMKLAIGRIEARSWLLYPHAKEFHWFHGRGMYIGFPSGHMAVFTALALAVATLHPRFRPACYGFLSLLALALIATNYHFLSDVIAGTYLGYLVHSAAQQRLVRSLAAAGRAR